MEQMWKDIQSNFCCFQVNSIDTAHKGLLSARMGQHIVTMLQKASSNQLPLHHLSEISYYMQTE